MGYMTTFSEMQMICSSLEQLLPSWTYINHVVSQVLPPELLHCGAGDTVVPGVVDR